MIRRWIFLLSLSLAGAWVVRTYLYESMYVATGSMEPTLYVDSHYLVNRAAYLFHGPARGDIISLISPLDGETKMVKRVIAVGGDQIEIRDKRVVLNGKTREEPYAIHKRAKETLSGDNIGPLQVPSETVFVLGDNRDVSDDSSVWVDRATGQPIYFLPEKNIRGHVLIFQ